ncbi:MAG TPA: MmcQ/YjbR family DNA-binding protein [Blastocatellia bacterium]|nr:MmcQ/YjbR family DNA-binding protein [Blastocatellia bacterium]
MTADQFRKIALSLPEAIESAHMGHPDFRVRGKIFATLYPGETAGMVKLTPEQQEAVVQAEPKVFTPVKGGWGRRGCTTVNLLAAKPNTARKALTLAWRNTAPKRLVESSKTS